MHVSTEEVDQPATAASGAVRQVPVPATMRRLGTLPRIDYEDGFVVDIGSADERTPEQWARATLEDAPAARRRSLLLGWSALGLRLGPTAGDGHVLGWEIRRSTADHVLLGLGSRLGMPAELLFARRRRALFFATFVQHENAAVSAVWAKVIPVHVRVVPQLLAAASRRG
jgi:hypothetical protein